jgi:delta14-sterol reductase
MESILGFLFPIIIYSYILFLNTVLPARKVVGYATKAGTTEKLKYRLNGLLVLCTVILTWVILYYSEILPRDWLYTYRWHGLAGAVVFGLIFSLWIMLSKPAVTKSVFVDFYLGRLENPQWFGGRIDAKMWLYLVGAIMLELNVLSFAMHHYMLYGEDASLGIFLSAGLLTYFVLDYLTFEEVHLYTYDLFAERVGFKLGWGCIAFYPFFYVIPLWSTVALPVSTVPTGLLVLFATIFFSGWGLARGANLQKYYFKKNPMDTFLGITPETISDGNKRLLVNGFWGLSRHINYLGEILMATGIVLATGHYILIWPWLYPLYYVVLLVPRQLDDDKRCAMKYGPLWQEYKKRVPYRIIPYIY